MHRARGLGIAVVSLIAPTPTTTDVAQTIGTTTLVTTELTLITTHDQYAEWSTREPDTQTGEFTMTLPEVVTLATTRATEAVLSGIVHAHTGSTIHSMVQAYTVQQGRLLFDSGAAVHVCPRDYAAEYTLCTNGNKPSLRTVTG